MNAHFRKPRTAPAGPAEPDEAASDSLSRELKIGGGVAAVFFVGLLGWGAMIPLDAGAVAQGVVAVSGSRQAVQHRDGGIVTAISVREGSSVRKGDVLLQISASELVAVERGMTGEVIALLAQRARLRAERDHAAALVQPEEFAELPAEDRALAQDAMQVQQMLFNARRRSIETERSVLEKRLGQHTEQIGGFQARATSNRVQHRLSTEELEGMKTLVDRGYVSLNHIRGLERGVAALDGDYGSYRAEIARSGESIGETRLQMVGLDRKLIEEVATQMRETQMRLDELQPKLISTREQLARAIVRAPASGQVVGLKVFTVGGVVASGDTLMEVVPQDRRLVVEARVAPTDADDLTVGMQTQVRFSALQERNLPILKGTITKLSADSFEDPRTGQRYFNIEVVAPPSELAKIRQVRGDSGLKAGLPAEVMVPLRQRSALAYLVEPITQTLWRVGREQ
jgi:HlyD family type I secretion membrane fusion protein